MPKKPIELDGFDEANAAILAEMLVDLQTPESIRLHIINELNEAAETTDFFEVMFNEMLSFCSCPTCGHENHWLVPEDRLNTFGWVSSQNDPRVKALTTAKDCETFEEACHKKKNIA